MFIRKLTKLARKTRWQMQPASHVPLVWHVGRPNFGDDINPEFFARVTEQGFRLGSSAAPHLLGVGSILEKANANSTVLGSGYLRQPTEAPVRPSGVIAVRGQLTADHLGADDAWQGDPLCLVDQLVERPTPECSVGVVPHVMEIDRMRRELGDAARVIDVRRPVWQVIEAIGQCQTIFSQSLHGLIVADAFRIPNTWIAPSERMAGGTFKFDDYYSTTDQAKQPLRWSPSLLDRASRVESFVSNYRYDKQAYLTAINAAVAAFADERTSRTVAA